MKFIFHFILICLCTYILSICHPYFNHRLSYNVKLSHIISIMLNLPPLPILWFIIIFSLLYSLLIKHLFSFNFSSNVILFPCYLNVIFFIILVFVCPTPISFLSFGGLRSYFNSFPYLNPGPTDSELNQVDLWISYFWAKALYKYVRISGDEDNNV